jgi:hypothetical protein
VGNWRKPLRYAAKAGQVTWPTAVTDRTNWTNWTNRRDQTEAAD